MLKYIFFLWELPQNIVGLIFWMVYRNRIRSFDKSRGRVFLQVTDFGISLGSFIFWSDYGDRDNKLHEYGHSIQSRILGPLYLIIVGVPSLLRASYARYYFRKNKTAWQNYYNGFPENWAERLSS